MTSLDRWNIILNAVGVGAFVILGIFLAIIMHRQRKDLSTSIETLATVTETVTTLADYALLHDEDSRKWRHAIRNLALALNMREVVRVLDEPPTFERASTEERSVFLDGLLDERLAASSSGDPEAARGDSR